MVMAEPINIQLEPYDALTILCFLREFEMTHKWVQSLADAVDRYEDQIVKNITPDQVDDAEITRHIMQVIGREPEEGK
jgi:hypothetical protein